MSSLDLAIRANAGCETVSILALSIVIPAFDEAARLSPTLAASLDYLDQRGIPGEIIVVDDGSSDGTADIVREHARVDARVSLIRLEENRGKGFAVREGVRAARGELVLFMDADLATPIEELENLERAIAEGCDVAVGSRALPTSTTSQTGLRKLMSRTFNVFVRLVAIGGISDTQCGFKLFTRRAAKALFGAATIDRYAFDVEILLLARGRFAVAEVPVAWRHVDNSKIYPLRDSLHMMLDILAMRLCLAARPAVRLSRESLLPAPAK